MRKLLCILVSLLLVLLLIPIKVSVEPVNYQRRLKINSREIAMKFPNNFEQQCVTATFDDLKAITHNTDSPKIFKTDHIYIKKRLGGSSFGVSHHAEYSNDDFRCKSCNN